MKRHTHYFTSRASIVSLFLSLCAVVLYACPVQAGTVSPPNMVIASGSPGGTHYYMAAGISKIITDKIAGKKATTETTTGSPVENFNFVNNSVDTMGMGTIDGFVPALSGRREDGYRGPLTKLNLVMTGHTQTGYTVVMKSSGITKYSDFKGKKIGTLSKGSSVRSMIEVVLNEYNLDPKKDYRFVPLSLTEQVDALKDGNIQVKTAGGSIPLPSVLDISNSNDVHLMSIEPHVQEALLKKYPYYNIGTIPAGTFRGQEHDVAALQAPAVMACNADLDDGFVYELIKAVDANNNIIVDIHPEGKNWNIPKSAAFFVKHPELPWHPGARKVYEEYLAKNPAK